MRFSGYWHRLIVAQFFLYTSVWLPCIRACTIAHTFHSLTYIQHEIHLCVCIKARKSRAEFPLTIRERAACGFFHSIPFDFNGILCHCTFRVCRFTSDTESKEEEVLHKEEWRKRKIPSPEMISGCWWWWMYGGMFAIQRRTHTYTNLFMYRYYELSDSARLRFGHCTSIPSGNSATYRTSKNAVSSIFSCNQPLMPVHLYTQYLHTHTNTRTHLFKCNADWMAFMYAFIQQTNREK